MKLTRSAVISLVLILLSAPVIFGQDLSKYRDFALGMSLADLSKQIDARPADIKLVHQHPALIEELSWWPRISGYPPRPEAIREVLFSFCDGKLYRIYVTYDGSATEGMTNDDMARVISETYGTPSTPDARMNLATGAYGATEKVIDRWEDSQYSVNLLRPSFSSTFALVLVAKQLNAEAEAASDAASKLEQQGAPQKAIDRKKKEADDREAMRVKNMKTFQP